MKQFTARLVTNHLQRLRISLLIVLCFMALGLWMDGRTPRTAPVSSDSLAGLTVALDPGHGGYDGGARARESGVWEKELNLQIAKAVETALAERGAAVTLTRTQDVCLSEDGSGKSRKRADLQKRLEVAEAAGADVGFQGFREGADDLGDDICHADITAFRDAVQQLSFLHRYLPVR